MCEKMRRGVSNACNYRDGVSCEVDLRTGKSISSISLPVISGINKKDLSISYDQNNVDLGHKILGLPIGWQYNFSYILNGYLYINGEKSYMIDSNIESGMRYYKFKNMKFEYVDMKFPYDESRYCKGVLKFIEGENQYFDDNGLLIGIDDRFGNHIIFYYENDSSVYESRLKKIKSSYNQYIIFSYNGKEIVVKYPEGINEIVVKIKEDDNGYIDSYVDGVGNQTLFENKGGLVNNNLLSKIEYQNGLIIEYKYGTMRLLSEAGDLTMDCVKAISKVYKGEERITKYNFDLDGEDKNYTGYPKYSISNKDDSLLLSNDNSYRYGVEVDDGVLKTRYEYNYLHLEMDKKAFKQDGTLLYHSNTIYNGQNDSGYFPDYYSLPFNYQSPKREFKKVYDEEGNYRTYINNAVTDDHGNLSHLYKYESSKDNNFIKQVETITKRDYENYGFVISTKTNAEGKITLTKNKLTEDNKNIKQATEGYVKGGEFKSTRVLSFKYDEKGRKIYAKLEKGEESISGSIDSTDSSLIYDLSDKYMTVTQVNAQGNKFVKKYDKATNWLVSASTAIGNTVSYVRDNLGRVLSVTDPSGAKTKYDYDDKNSKITKVNPNGYKEYSYYNGYGDQIKISDDIGNGERTLSKIGYDSKGRIIEIEGILGDYSKVNYHYNDRGLISATVDALGNTSKYVYDVVGQTLKAYTNGILITESHIDDIGNVNDAIMYSNDHKNKIKCKAKHDFKGDLLELEGEQKHSNKKEFQYDDQYLLSDVKFSGWDGIKSKSEFTKDLFHNVIKTKVKIGEESAQNDLFVYNNLNQLIEEQNALNQKYIYGYNADGKLKSSKNYAGITFTYEHDPNGRIIKESYKGSDGIYYEKKISYDLDTGLVKSIEEYKNAKGQGSIDYTYSINGLLTSMKYPDGKSMSITYDDKNRPIESTDFFGNITFYNYDKYGRVVSTGLKDGSSEIKLIYYTKKESNAQSGMIKSILEDAHIETSIEYDSFNRTKSTTVKDLNLIDGKNILSKIDYQYDESTGNIVQTKYTSTASTDDAVMNKIVYYDYNSLNQLIKERETSLSGKKISSKQYIYDAAINISQETIIDENGTKNIYYTYDSDNKLISIKDEKGLRKLEYDVEGNLLSDGNGNKYVYNDKSQLIEHYYNGLKTVYTYYPTGLRKSKKVGSEDEIIFYQDSAANIANESQGSVYTHYFRFGNDRKVRYITEGQNITQERYIKNYKNDTLAILNKKSEFKDFYRYDPYGKSNQVNKKDYKKAIYSNPFKYTGEYMDYESGLVYLRSRYYNPDIKRFISRDRANQFNRYYYCNGNPVMFTDPSGRGIATLALSEELGEGIGSFFGPIGFFAALIISLLIEELLDELTKKTKKAKAKSHKSKTSKESAQHLFRRSNPNVDPSAANTPDAMRAINAAFPEIGVRTGLRGGMMGSNGDDPKDDNNQQRPRAENTTPNGPSAQEGDTRQQSSDPSGGQELNFGGSQQNSEINLEFGEGELETSRINPRAVGPYHAIRIISIIFWLCWDCYTHNLSIHNMESSEYVIGSVIGVGALIGLVRAFVYMSIHGNYNVLAYIRNSERNIPGSLYLLFNSLEIVSLFIRDNLDNFIYDIHGSVYVVLRVLASIFNIFSRIFLGYMVIMHGERR